MKKAAFYNVVAFIRSKRRWIEVASAVPRPDAALAVAKQWKEGNLARAIPSKSPKAA